MLCTLQASLVATERRFTCNASVCDSIYKSLHGTVPPLDRILFHGHWSKKGKPIRVFDTVSLVLTLQIDFQLRAFPWPNKFANPAQPCLGLSGFVWVSGQGLNGSRLILNPIRWLGNSVCSSVAGSPFLKYFKGNLFRECGYPWHAPFIAPSIHHWIVGYAGPGTWEVPMDLMAGIASGNFRVR